MSFGRTRPSRRHSLATDAQHDGSLLYDDVIVVGARPDALDEVHAALDRCWQALEALPRPPTVEWRDLFRTAVVEIATNIIRYAYPPGAPRGVLRLRLALQPDGLEAWFADHGIEWTPGDSPTEIDPLSLHEGGRGLIVARAAVDDLHYERDAEAGENVWHLTKHFLGAT